MKKKSCLALAMLLCLLQVVTVFAVVPASAASDVARSYQIAKSTVAPTIDGVVDDVWENYNWSESFVLAKSVAGDFTNENLKGKFKAFWIPDATDETKITLYYLVEVAGDVTLHDVDGMKVCLLCNKEKKFLEFEITIPEQYEELLEKKAAEQGITVEELLESAIRKFLERNKDTNGK